MLLDQIQPSFHKIRSQKCQTQEPNPQKHLLDLGTVAPGAFAPHQGIKALEPIGKSLENPGALGLPVDLLTAKAMEDTAIDEFCRFYQERLTDELKAAGEDMQRRKKLEDDFTPRVEIVLVGLEGTFHRQLRLRVSYRIGNEMTNYESFLTLNPSAAKALNQPEMGTCGLTGVTVPHDCLGKCEISGKVVMRNLLNRSEISSRLALPDHMVVCALSGKRVLSDEVEKSAVTGRSIALALLKTSALSRRRAEPEFFARCEFSGAEVLESELTVSQVSGKRYRIDKQSCSVISGKYGHRSEFISCSETQQTLLPTEAEKCESTGKLVESISFLVEIEEKLSSFMPRFAPASESRARVEWPA